MKLGLISTNPKESPWRCSWAIYKSDHSLSTLQLFAIEEKGTERPEHMTLAASYCSLCATAISKAILFQRGVQHMKCPNEMPRPVRLAAASRWLI